MLTLRLRQPNSLPIDAAGFLPEACDSLERVSRFPLLLGNQSVDAAELFAMHGDPAARRWRLEGDLARVHHLGEGMTSGQIVVHGNLGAHAGTAMTGGQIVIQGDAGDCLGAEMSGGQITVHGDGGSSLGAAYPGSRVGMRGGVIIVHGSVCDSVGEAMRRGLIVVGRDAGRLAGYRMKAGTILVLGGWGSDAGLAMRRGTLGLFGEEGAALPVAFRRACRLAPAALGVLRRHVGQVAGESFVKGIPEEVELYSGDLLQGGRGEVFTR